MNPRDHRAPPQHDAPASGAETSGPRVCGPRLVGLPPLLAPLKFPRNRGKDSRVETVSTGTLIRPAHGCSSLPYCNAPNSGTLRIVNTSFRGADATRNPFDI